MAGITEQLKV